MLCFFIYVWRLVSGTGSALKWIQPWLCGAALYCMFYAFVILDTTWRTPVCTRRASLPAHKAFRLHAVCLPDSLFKKGVILLLLRWWSSVWERWWLGQGQGFFHTHTHMAHLYSVHRELDVLDRQAVPVQMALGWHSGVCVSVGVCVCQLCADMAAKGS